MSIQKKISVFLATCALGILALSTLQAFQSHPADRPLLITGGTLIDGTGRQPLPDAAILIEKGRISRVGSTSEFAAPAGAEVIQARGQFVLPGLWESHMHYRGWHGELLLHYGITTAVDLGNQLEWIEAVKDGINKGKVRAPRLFTAGWILHGTPEESEPEAGLRYRTQAYQRQFVKENYPNHVFVRGGPEMMRRFARQQIDAGVDAFKVFPDMSREELRVLSEEADRAGIPVIGHLKDRSLEEAFGAIHDGLQAITHAHGIARALLSDQKRQELSEGRIHTAFAWMQMDKADDLIKLMVDRGVYLGPAIIHGIPPEVSRAAEYEEEDRRLLARPEFGYIRDETRVAMPAFLHRYRIMSDRYGEFPPKEMLPPEVRAEFRKGSENVHEFVRRFARAGGKLFTGTDLPGGTPSIPGLGVHREMQVWVEEIGLSPMQAIVASTREPARLMRKDTILGTVEPGKIADLVIVSADPLADIRNTQKIQMVIKDGAVVDRTLDRYYSPPFREIGSEGAHNITLPVPSIVTLRPRVAIEGAEDTQVVLEGAGLHITSQVFVGDELVPSKMLDHEHLELTVPAHLLTRGGSLPVRVYNPAPGGGHSRPYGFIVRFR